MAASTAPLPRRLLRFARTPWACAAAYAAVLLLGVTLPLRLDQHPPSHTTNLAFIYGRDLTGIAAYLALTIALLSCWLWALNLARSSPKRRIPIWVAGVAVFGGILLAAHPVYSFDVFHYAATARVHYFHGENPHIIPPARFPDDPITPLSDWRNLPSPYGPAWSWISAVPYAISGGFSGPISALLAFKLLAITATTLSALLLARTAERLLPGSGAFAAVAFGWNPLVILHLLGDAHNEAMMLAPLAAAVLALTAGRLTLALVLIALATLIKPPAAFAGILIALPLLRERRWRVLVPAALLSALLAVLLWLPLWAGPRTLEAAFDEGRYFTSTPAALALLLIEPDARDAWNPWAGAALRLALLGVALVLGLTSPSTPTHLLRRLTVLYVLAVFPLSGWYQPWYATWALLPLALPVSGADGRRVALGLTLGGLLVVIAPGFLAGLLNRNGGTDDLIAVIATLLAHTPVALALLPVMLRRPRHAEPEPGGPQLAAVEPEQSATPVPSPTQIM